MVVPAPLIPSRSMFVPDRFKVPELSMSVKFHSNFTFDKFASPSFFIPNSLSLKVVLETFNSPSASTLKAVSKFDIVPPEPITFNI